MLMALTVIQASFYCIVYCREDAGQILLTRLYEYLDQAEILPVKSQKTNRYDPFSREFPTEISKTKNGPQHDLCRQWQSFRHSQP